MKISLKLTLNLKKRINKFNRIRLNPKKINCKISYSIKPKKLFKIQLCLHHTLLFHHQCRLKHNGHP